ncbi:hypothetical protein GPJ56_009362 [Histomonas meleagridis]|uniref:uncharacterized protein n=1 Tax=Histomonas meleagridis TaxID=135588 RepID=UPI003559C198|nr:hypothetical protein GPJ56_009362 [Histomonas meleagridis]KAH0797314.1 hypothetical protein GO595_009996 [Histomonas meleagridis]
MLLSAGANSSYRLGRNDNSKKPLPPVDMNFNDIKCLAVGWRHNVVIYNNGTAIGWGDNSDFQFGLSKRKDDIHPTIIDNFADIPLSWAHCGDKCTTFLAQNGDVYITNSRCINGKPRKIILDNPGIYVSSSVSCSYAIDNKGIVYKIRDDGETTKYVLPSPAYDVAGGSGFALAVTVDGVAYGIGSIVKTDDEFTPIKSLNGVHVLRVFAYNDHAAIITTDGLTMTYGAGGSGRTGHGTIQKLNEFKVVEALRNVKITEIDMGDAHTIFISSDGSVYSCGASDEDGRLLCDETSDKLIPTKSNLIEGKAVFVRCGCFHSIVLVNSPPLLHPGMLAMGIIQTTTNEREITWGNIKLTRSPLFSFVSNHLPGDLLLYEKKDECIYIGKDSSKCIVLFEKDKTIKQIRETSLTFLTRKNYIGVKCESKVMPDGGDALQAFGLDTGEVVVDKAGKEYEVLGVANNSLALRDDPNHVLSDELNIFEIFTKYKLTKTKRNVKMIEIQNVLYPAQLIDAPFYANLNMPVEIMAKFGPLLIGKTLFNGYQFFSQKDILEIISKNNVYCYDTVLYNDKKGVVLSFVGDSAVFLSEEFDSEPVLAPLNELTVLTTVMPGVKRTVKEKSYDVSISCSKAADCLPGDLCVSQDGYATIIGFIDGEAFAEINGEIVPFQKEKMHLLRRSYDIRCDGLKFVTSQLEIISNPLISSMNETPFLQGDGVLVEDKEGVVCTTEDDYLWIITENDKGEKEFVTFYVSDPHLTEYVKFVSRPTKNIEFLMSCLK